MTRLACVGSLALLLSALLFVAPPPLAQTAKLVTESYHVPARDPGIQLYVRNKRPEGMSQFGAERIVLFVHGATGPSESSFDLALDGLSWMDYIAQHGFDVYLMDVRGYGASTRPPEMSQPATENPPIVNTDTAVRDVSAVVDHILARRSVSRINLLGWSWGTVLMAAYTAQNNDKVERLVLYAPVWLRTASSATAAPTPLGAYRTLTKEAIDRQRQDGRQLVPPEKQKALAPAEWSEAGWRALLATDPVGAAQTPPVVRSPNGVTEDGRKYWSAGTPYYDPARITVPVQLILAEWDAGTPLYMAQALFEKLTNATLKRHVVIGQGTHAVLLERNRVQLFREVQLFLEEPR